MHSYIHLWLQADLGGFFAVHRIATLGRGSFTPRMEYVSSYTVSYSTQETGENFVAAEAGQEVGFIVLEQLTFFTSFYFIF